MAQMEQMVDKIALIRELIANCKYDDALEHLEILQDLEPENFEVFYELARVYFELGDYESAISNYEQLLEHHNSAIMYFNLALAYEANNEIDKAVGNYLKCATLNEKFPFAHKKLGMLFMARGDKSSAREYFDRYLNLEIPEEEKEATRSILERLN
jgi:tetratricopeptide (TPR) repeat protein